jgi:hypothetical protein
MTDGYAVARIDELDRIEVMNGLEWRPIRRRFGIESFGCNAYTAAKPGDWVVEEHDEANLHHQEAYVVVRGHATFTLDGEELDAPTGTIVFIDDPNVKRLAVAVEEGTTVFALGASKDEPYAPSRWEWIFEAYAKNPEEGKAVLESGIAERGDHPAFHYHLACMHAKLGELDDARRELDSAFAADPSMRERAEADDDLKEVLA